MRADLPDKCPKCGFRGKHNTIYENGTPVFSEPTYKSLNMEFSRKDPAVNKPEHLVFHCMRCHFAVETRCLDASDTLWSEYEKRNP